MIARVHDRIPCFAWSKKARDLKRVVTTGRSPIAWSTLALVLLIAPNAAEFSRAQVPRNDSLVILQDSTAIPSERSGSGFGTISGLAALGNGNVFVADNRNRSLRLFSRAGVELASASLSSDQGGGVFATALAISNETLFLYDQTSGRMHSYQVIGRRIEQRRRFDVAVSGVSICAMGGIVYVLGFQNGAIIHAYDGNGRFIRSFGEGIGSSDPIRGAVITAGSRVRCLVESNVVVVMHNVSPVVRAFAPNGGLRWQYSIPGFRPISITSGAGTAVRFTLPRTPVDGSVSVFPMPHGWAGIQVSRGAPGGAQGGRRYTIETTIVNAHDGSVVARTTALGPMLDGSPGFMIALNSSAGGAKLRSYRYRLQEAR